MSECVFCQIAAHTAPASMVYEDDEILAFMALRPTAPGECLAIPRAHIDHFTDVGEDTAERLMRLALVIGRRIQAAFRPERIGMVVHGYGVAHAHLIVVPQHGPYHITSDRFVELVDGKINFNANRVPVAERALLDEHARRLAQPTDPERAA